MNIKNVIAKSVNESDSYVKMLIDMKEITNVFKKAYELVITYPGDELRTFKRFECDRKNSTIKFVFGNAFEAEMFAVGCIRFKKYGIKYEKMSVQF